MRKHIITLALTLASSIIITGTSFAETADSSDPVTSYNKLMESFKRQRSSTEYPEYYGGAYINDNNELVVMVKGQNASTATQSNLQPLAGGDFIIENATYSYNELTELYNKLNKDMDSKDEDISSIFDDVIGFGIYSERNKIVVRINDISDEKVNAFQNMVSDSDAIEFEDGEFSTPNLTVKPANGILISSNGGQSCIGGSIGFRCQRVIGGKTYNGFVTAGHSLSGSETIYDSNWNYIGAIKGVVYSGKCDASFVAASDASVATSTANGTTIKGNHYAITFPEGSTVTKHGVNGVSSGVIKSSSYTVNHGGGIRIKDCVEASYSSSDGDSGGVILTNVNGDNVPTGIHNSSGGGKGYYCKITNIINALGVTPY